MEVNALLIQPYSDGVINCHVARAREVLLVIVVVILIDFDVF